MNSGTAAERKRSLRLDFWVIMAIVFLSVPLILWGDVRPMTSALFFFVLPTLFLSLRKAKQWKQIVLGSLLIGGGLGLIFNVILSYNQAWVEVPSQLYFNYYIFGFWPVDEPVWFVLWAMFILVFYEHFHDVGRKSRLSKHFLALAVPTFTIAGLVLIAFALRPDMFRLPYAYFLLASPCALPVAYVARYKPQLLFRFLRTGLFFFMLYLIYELTAVSLGQWEFPGQYVGLVTLMNISFPLEELVFWMGLSPITVLAVYEGFVDDGR